MSMVPPSLLCLGLCLSQSTWAQKGNLPPPRITALPGSTVPAKGPVTLLCQGPKQAEGYRISRVGSPEPMDREKQITSRKTDTLSIIEMTFEKTGLYHCSYQRGGRWSQFSDPLQLVMTGAYDKPSLSSMAGTVVAPGENVKLQCFSKINHDVFILTKEDGDHVTQNQSSVPQDRGRQAIFLLNPVSSTQAGTYRCYGAFHDNPYVWSQPSDPLQLQVEGTTDSPSSTQPRHSTAPSGNLASQDRRLGIWIGVPVAVGLLLLVFLVFFILYCLHKAKNNAERKERHPEAAGQVNGQASEAADPQEVTYSQVNCHVPHQGTAGTLLGAQTDPEQRVCDAGLQISQAPGPALHLGSRTHSYLW
uniref:Immunoglobulin domain-containing protein n=1 Tax=Bos mutus grunniens TaxID=30521 RepID=A0A8B9XXM2_BOSMU